jgi:excisionase family DNA binding protein
MRKDAMAIAAEDLADFTTLTEAARVAGMARNRLNELVLAGELPAIRFGHTWYVRRQDVNAVTRQRRSHQSALGSKNHERVRQTLAILATNDGATTRDLMALTDAPRRTVLSRLQLLEARGLVRRENDGGPKDPDRAYLTEDGWRYFREELNLR